MKIDNPCYDRKTKTSCNKRCAGCALTCEDWQDYVKRRDANYLEPKRNLVDEYECIRAIRFRKTYKRK